MIWLCCLSSSRGLAAFLNAGPFLLTLMLALAMSGCEGPAPQAPAPGEGAQAGEVDRGPPIEWVTAKGGEPTIRVRVQRSPRSVRITTTGGQGRSIAIRAAGSGGTGQQVRVTPPVRIERQAGAYLIRASESRGWRWPATRLTIEPIASGGRGRPMLVMNHRYPGHLELVASPRNSGPSPTAFDVVNHLPLKIYVAGVIAKELYGSWDAAAFRAQAIAARSYALFEAYERRHRHFDLMSTTASQVYQGLSDNPRATAAAEATRGQVIVHRGRVLPAYYSSACGGAGQSAHLAFDSGWHVTPLMGQGGLSWCRKSDKYRWGPITRSADDLAYRLRKWGQARGHAVGKLSGLRRIEIAKRNHTGRPAAFTLTDAAGRRFTLGCEPFRMACNYQAGSLSDLSKAKRLPSSYVEPAVSGRVVRFTNGRGFGHGVGMCQWGAQGMARAGYDHPRILGQYYPGASLKRVY